MIARGVARRFALSLVVSLVLFGLGLTALDAALDVQNAREEEYQRAIKERDLIASRLRQSLHDEPEIRRALERFDALTNQGLVGPERRLDWTERLGLIRNRRKIPAIEFELAPLRKLPGNMPELSLNASTMRLRARLVHEGDLLNVLDDLQNQGSAIVIPRHCVIERGNDADTALPLALNAECELDWVTLSHTAPTP